MTKKLIKWPCNFYNHLFAAKKVFKDSDADFNLGVAIGFAQAIPVAKGQAVVKIAIRGQLFDPEAIGRNENGEFYVTV